MEARRFVALAVRRIVGRGLIPAADVHRYGIQGRDLSHSNGVVLVEAGNGRTFVVKSAVRTEDAGQGSSAVEVAVYRAAGRHPRLSGLVPDLREYNEETGLLVLEGLHTSRGLERLSGGHSAYGPEVAEWFGRALGEWHRHAAALEGFAPTEPWVLRLEEEGRLTVIDTVRALRRLADEVISDPALSQAIRWTRSAWNATTLIHGDIRFSNTLVQTSPPAVRFVDWEMAGLGDPAWDVAGAIQDYVCLFGLETPLEDPRTRSVIQSFLDAYGRASHRPLVQEGLAPFVACRLILRAFQLVGRSEGWETAVEAHLESARTFSAQGIGSTG